MRARHRGFTLLELVCSMAILSLVFAFLLPSVFQSRENARRAQCQHKLAQLGIALHHYHQVHNMLPPGTTNPTGPIRHDGQGYHFSWTTQILPYLSHRNLYSKIDFQKSVYENDLPKLPPEFHCSSSRAWQFDGSNYAGCHHDREGPIDADNNGVLYLNSSIRFRDISDGRHATVMIGEVEVQERWAHGTRASLRNMSGINAPADRATFEKEMQIETSIEFEEAMEKRLQNADDPQLLVGGFLSRHIGGVNFCFADASVKFLSNRIDNDVRTHLGNRHDGVLLDEF